MKRKASKILGLLLAVLMVVSLLPMTALAVEEYNVWVGETRVTSDNCANIPGVTGGTASYAPATKTLTFTGI